MNANLPSQFPARFTGKFNTGALATSLAYFALAGAVFLILLVTKLNKASIYVLAAAMVFFGLIGLVCLIFGIINENIRESFRDLVMQLDELSKNAELFLEEHLVAIKVGSVTLACFAVIGLCGSLYYLACYPRDYGYIAMPLLFISIFGLVPLLAFTQD